MMSHLRPLGAVLLLVSLGACAARTPAAPALPASVRYPEFVYPVVPEGLRSAPTVQRVDSGWRFLQNGDLRNADREFSAALKRTPRLYPAEAGAAYVALADRDNKEALRRFDAALSESPSYVPAPAGKAGWEGSGGESELDGRDGASLGQIGEILEQRLDLAGAEAAYRKAAAIEPTAELTRRIAGVADKTREAKLPSEFRAIPAASQITRGELAALIGVRLDGLLDEVKPQQVVMTDVRNHWAAAWITRVAAAGVLEPFANHTFQPRTGLRRVDLATAVSRLLTVVAAKNPELRARWAEAKPKIADVSVGHLSYPAVSLAVASGVMPLLEEDRFAVGRAVSGAEAIDVIGRVLMLARRSS